jgi:hypothetical protein
MAEKDKGLRGIGRELRDNPPRILAKTLRKKGPKAAERQRRAILLSKARTAGIKTGKKTRGK